MSFHWWRNPGATYLVCLLVLILIGVGQSYTLRDELAVAQRLKREVLDLNKKMVSTLAHWERTRHQERQQAQAAIEDERLAHQEFQGWVMETFPALQQAWTIRQFTQRLTAVEAQVEAQATP